MRKQVSPPGLSLKLGLELPDARLHLVDRLLPALQSVQLRLVATSVGVLHLVVGWSGLGQVDS